MRAVNLAEAITHAIDSHRAEMQELLAALVAIPSENPPATRYTDCVARLESALVQLGFEYERIEIDSPADAPRIVLRAWIGDAGPALYFHGHYDVVPAQSPEQFAPRVEGDVLFGRGSSDMKSGLVSMLYAARAVRSAVDRLGGRIGLVLVPDEETGGRYGAAALASRGELGVDGIGMLLPEPTSGVVWHANRGAITLEVTVRGRSAHVGLARHGVNALERAMPLLARLFDDARELERVRDSVLLVGGRAEAGTNFNVVPDRCVFTIDRRPSPDEDFDGEKQRLLAEIERARTGGAEIDVRILQEGRAASTSADAPLARALTASVADVTGEPPAFETCPGLLEIRFYAERGIPALAYGPGILAVSHGPHEFVKISRMVECANVYALTAVRMFGHWPTP
jgi:succinyl-diaminopimelate desuccinylase